MRENGEGGEKREDGGVRGRKKGREGGMKREKKRKKLTSSDWQYKAGIVVLQCHQDVASPCRLPKRAAQTLATTSSLQAARRRLG